MKQDQNIYEKNNLMQIWRQQLDSLTTNLFTFLQSPGKMLCNGLIYGKEGRIKRVYGITRQEVSAACALM